jgi:hypothetical protein
MKIPLVSMSLLRSLNQFVGPGLSTGRAYGAFS